MSQSHTRFFAKPRGHQPGARYRSPGFQESARPWSGPTRLPRPTRGDRHTADRGGVAVAPFAPHPSDVSGDRRERFISRNTVKTQAISIYRKLGVSSRKPAVEAARKLGFLD